MSDVLSDGVLLPGMWRGKSVLCNFAYAVLSGFQIQSIVSTDSSVVGFVLLDMWDTMADLRQREAEREYTILASCDCVGVNADIWRGEEHWGISIYSTGSDKGAIRKENGI